MFNNNKVETDLISFINNFDSDKQGVASYLAKVLDEYGVEEVYWTLERKLEEIKEQIENKKEINNLPEFLEFVRYVLLAERQVPGMRCTELKNAIIGKKEIGFRFKNLFLDCKNSLIRFQLLSVLNLDGILEESFENEIENVILKSEWVLSYWYIKNIWYKKKEPFIDKAISTKNRYLIWGFIDAFIELMDPQMEDYIEKIENLDDLVLKERIRFYKKKKEILERMYDENRLEMLPEEEKSLNSIFSFYPFFGYVVNTFNIEHYSEQDLDGIVKRIWIQNR